MHKAKIILADDHVMVAQALLSYLVKSFDVVGIVSDGLQLLARVRKQQPDAVVADIGMPGMSGLEALRQMRREGLTTKVIFLTMHADPLLAREAMLAGASGYVLKDAAGDELVTAVRQVLSGNIYLSSRIARQVMSAISSPATPSKEKITPRQLEVLQLVVSGRTMKEVAAVLELSPRTVETHKYVMMQTLGVQTTAELIQYAFRHNMVSDFQPVG
jgi:DNA-binding NarL/FixJ family response regulator